MYPHHVFDLEPAGTFGMYPICYQQVSGRYFQPEPAMYSRCFHWFPGPLAPSVRMAHIQDSLAELRHACKIHCRLLVNHYTQIARQGQWINTHSCTVLNSVESCISKFVKCYRIAYNALLRLDPDGNWQVLNRGSAYGPYDVNRIPLTSDPMPAVLLSDPMIRLPLS